MIVVFVVGTVVSLIVKHWNLVEIKPLDRKYYVSFFRAKVDPNAEQTEVEEEEEDMKKDVVSFWSSWQH